MCVFFLKKEQKMPYTCAATYVNWFFLKSSITCKYFWVNFFRLRNVLTSLQFLIFVVASFFVCLCVYHFLCFEGFFVCRCVFFFFIISFFITLALQSASVFFTQEYQTSFSSIITFFHSAFFSGIFLCIS